MNMNMRKLATSSTIGTFMVASLSGLLLFFEVGPGSVRATHEWISVLFLGAAVFHVFNHKKPFMQYFKANNVAPVLIGMLLGVVLYSAAYDDIYAAGAIFESTIDSGLKEVVFLFDVDLKDAVATLEAQGIQVDSHAQTLSDLANKNGLDVYDVIDPLLEMNKK